MKIGILIVEHTQPTRKLIMEGKCKGEHGAFAPGSEMHFHNVKKFRKKYARVYVVVSSVRQMFCPKTTFYLTCVKKTKICHM